MRECQIGQISQRIEIALSSVHDGNGEKDQRRCLFWIDTLCIPGEESAPKTKAIALMEHVYRRATAVLVLGSDLEALTIEASAIDRLLQIALSRWWTRLWTLQEGVFAKRLLFQFRDHSVTLSQIYPLKNLLETHETEGAFDVAGLVARDIINVLTDFSLSNIRAEQGRYIIRNIAWRFTTRKSDEAICLAILLGLDVSSIHSLPEDPDVRMKTFIRMQKHFPSSILFRTQSNNNLDENGLRWAPKTFLGRTSGGESSMHLRNPDTDYRRAPSTPDTAIADQAGLHAEYHGIELSLSRGFRTFLHNSSRLDVLCESDMFAYAISITSATDLTWDKVSEWKRPAVILPRPMSPKVRMSLGTLVSIYSETDGKFFCRFQTRVVLWLYARPCSTEQALQFVKNYARLTLLSEDQKWCIG